MADNLNLKPGDVVEHNLLPGFRMTIRATADCEVDSTRPAPHKQYQIIDPEGNEDWMCGYDARLVGGSS